MAVLQLEDGTTYRDIKAIASQLAGLNIEVDRLPLKENPAVRELLVQDVLNLTQKQQILETLKSDFEKFKRVDRCQW